MDGLKTNISKESLKMLEDKYSALYKKANNPFTSGREREELFKQIEFGKINLLLAGLKIVPPNNRGNVHIVSNE